MDLSGVDSYQVADGRQFAVAARSLPRTTTLQKWASLYVGTAVPSFCTKSRGYRATTLGGARALAFTGHCEVHDINIGLTTRRGRGYVFARERWAGPASGMTPDGSELTAVPGRRSFCEDGPPRDIGE